jgi:zinc protease
VIWTWGVLGLALAVGADAMPPARPFSSPGDLVSVDSSLSRIERFVLPNGMSVVLAPDAEAPVVALALSYDVGVRDEPDERPGLASVVQNLMLHGTKHVGAGEYERQLKAAGARWSWRTKVDSSLLSVTVPWESIALPLWLWSDQMGFLSDSLTEARVAQAVATIDENHERRVDDVAMGHTWQMIERALYPEGHPYHRLATPPGQFLRGLTVAEVRTFVQRFYTPDRAHLVISGAFDPARTRQLVTRYFAGLRGGPAGARRTAERPLPGREQRLQLAARVNLPAVTVAWSTPPMQEPDDIALDIVAELLIGHRAGLLRLKLIDELKVATKVSAREYSRRLGSVFVINATAAPGHTAADLLSAIDGVLSDVTVHPASSFMFTGAVAGYVIDHLFRLQVHATRAELYAQCDAHGILATCIPTWLNGYLQLTDRQLSDTIARQLRPDRRVVIQVVPSPDAPIAGAPSDIAP